MGGRYPVLKSENNNVEFLQLLCTAFLDCGCRNIEIGHSSLHGYEYDEKYHKYKIDKDIQRQNEIEHLLKCSFIRIKEEI